MDSLEVACHYLTDPLTDVSVGRERSLIFPDHAGQFLLTIRSETRTGQLLVEMRDAFSQTMPLLLHSPDKFVPSSQAQDQQSMHERVVFLPIRRGASFTGLEE